MANSINLSFSIYNRLKIITFFFYKKFLVFSPQNASKTLVFQTIAKQ